MKLLLFSDLHCDTAAAEQLVKLAEDVDVVVGAGDFANCRRGIDQTINVLKKIVKPSVVVPGNGESIEELCVACQGWQEVPVLHGAGIEIENVPFYGIGGGIPVTPFGDWSYDFTEEQAEELLADCPSNGVIVSHSPPYGILDGTLGSHSLLQTIQDKLPRLVVCGHIHSESGQSQWLENTQVVNAGPRGMMVQLDG